MITKEAAIECLKEQYGLRNGGKIYTLVSYVSKSGMTKGLRVFVVINDGIREITKLVCWACGEKYKENVGRIMKGTGYSIADMTCDDLRWVLYGSDMTKWLRYEEL